MACENNVVVLEWCTQVKSLSFPMLIGSILSRYYSHDEFCNLCFVLDVEYEDLGVEALSDRKREFLLRMERYGRLDDLASYIIRTRPFLADLVGEHGSHS